MSRTVRGKTLGIQEPFISHRWDDWAGHCNPNHTKAVWRRRQAQGQHRDADATALTLRPALPSRLDRLDSGSGRETDINDLCCPQLVCQWLFTDPCARRIGRRRVAASQSQPNQSASRMTSRRNSRPHPPTSNATVGGLVEPRGSATLRSARGCKWYLPTGKRFGTGTASRHPARARRRQRKRGISEKTY